MILKKILKNTAKIKKKYDIQSKKNTVYEF